MSIDWKARLKNKYWWIGIISVTISIGFYFGFDLTKYIGQDWKGLVGLIFGFCGYLGITVDTSTTGIADDK